MKGGSGSSCSSVRRVTTEDRWKTRHPRLEGRMLTRSYKGLLNLMAVAAVAAGLAASGASGAVRAAAGAASGACVPKGQVTVAYPTFQTESFLPSKQNISA